MQPFIEKNGQLFADKKAIKLLKGYPQLTSATSDDFDREFLSLACAVKIVRNEAEAMLHIEKDGTRHSKAIITKNKKNRGGFLANR